MKREMKKRRIFPLGCHTPLGGCPLLSYKRSPLLPLLTLLILPFPAYLLPNLCLSLAKLCPIFSLYFIHLEKCMLECLADPFFRCPARPRAWRRQRQVVRMTEYGGTADCGALYTILRSSSERLRRLRQVNDYVDYVRLRQVFTSNVCSGT
jgi:hypothetical protein